MHYEVEQKFRLPPDLDFPALLATREIPLGEAVEQRDLYFQHPARDYAQTDEALRLRRIGDANFVTYKGPKVDSQTKTRRELELPLLAGEAGFEGFRELLIALHFRPVLEVRKLRRTAHLNWQALPVEIAFDQVTDLGRFVELETVAEQSQLNLARTALEALASSLGLKAPERRSYLELVLQQNANQETP